MDSLMPMLVITPIPPEFEAFAPALEERWGRPRERDVGRIAALDYAAAGVVLARGGLGKAQFALKTQHLLDHLPGTDLVVCAGVAGSLVESVGVQDVVVATETVEHDFYSVAFQNQLPALEGSVPHIDALAGQSWSGLASCEVHFGPVASGDQTIVDPVRAQALHDRTGALAVAWEGAGGAKAAAFSGLPFLEVRGISDMADPAAPDVWEDNIPGAMRNVAAIVAWLAEHPVSVQNAGTEA